jgi:hypothetical protein
LAAAAPNVPYWPALGVAGWPLGCTFSSWKGKGGAATSVGTLGAPLLWQNIIDIRGTNVQCLPTKYVQHAYYEKEEHENKQLLHAGCHTNHAGCHTNQPQLCRRRSTQPAQLGLPHASFRQHLEQMARFVQHLLCCCR